MNDWLAAQPIGACWMTTVSLMMVALVTAICSAHIEACEYGLDSSHSRRPPGPQSRPQP